MEGIEYLKGVDNSLADGLSRMPEILVMTQDEENISEERLKHLQEQDPDFPELQAKLQFQKGVWKSDDRVFVPRVLRQRVLTSYHGVGIHFGIQKTLDVMRPVVFWPGLSADVTETIRTCDFCKVGKSNPVVQAPIQRFPSVQRPFQRVAMDFAGPFPASRKGNRYFLVIVDHFSKYVKVFPLPEATMETAIDCLRNVIFEEGLPEDVLTDQGSQFTGSKFQEFLRSNRIRHLRTSPYHPQCDGLAERQMRTIKDLIRCGLLEKADYDPNGMGYRYSEDCCSLKSNNS